MRLEILGMTAVYRHKILKVRIPENMVPYFPHAKCRHKMHPSSSCLARRLVQLQRITIAPGNALHNWHTYMMSAATEQVVLLHAARRWKAHLEGHLYGKDKGSWTPLEIQSHVADLKREIHLPGLTCSASPHNEELTAGSERLP